MSGVQPILNRRQFLGAAAIAILPKPGLTADTPIVLKAGTANATLVAPQGLPTGVWAYNGVVPGPLLRFRQGERLRIEVHNELNEPTTVHWHGLRPPVAMDGVPYLSQAPIEPGTSFLYDFDLLDAGTFWYHPHLNSSEQVGRGLRGALIVDEAKPIDVDRDVVWVMDDWRLDQDAQILPFGANMHDMSHAGRLGNTATINGSIKDEFAVEPGERIRLRLVNVANARNFALHFPQSEPWLIALDGQPVEPGKLEWSRILLAPGQRADLILDCLGKSGDVERIVDDAYGADYAYYIMNLAYGSSSRDTGRPAPMALAANPIPVPDLASAVRHEIVFEGGAMGGMRGAMFKGEYATMRELAQTGKLWAINGTVPDDLHSNGPLLSLNRDQTYILELINRTAFGHPIHLHGHTFQVISENGEQPATPVMRDTVLLSSDSKAEIAFVADNPGKWMFHCHILEHQESAMMAVVEVA